MSCTGLRASFVGLVVLLVSCGRNPPHHTVQGVHPASPASSEAATPKHDGAAETRAAWVDACAARFERARQAVAPTSPRAAQGTVTTRAHEINFESRDGTFAARVDERVTGDPSKWYWPLAETPAKEFDTLRDGWTREQFGLRGRLEASLPSAADVAAFGGAFRLAIDDCLSVGPTRPTPELTGRDGTVLELPGVALWKIGGHAIVTSVGYVAEIRDGVLSADPEITRGFPALDPRFDSVHASGSCGEALEQTLLFHARDDRTDLFRWQGGHWQASGSTEGTPTWCGSGRMLTVVRSSLQWGFRFRGPSTPVAQYLPTPARPGVSCRQRLIPDAFEALPSGHLFALGRECREGPASLAVERWAPGQTVGTFERLPRLPADANVEVDPTSLHAVSPSEVYVAGIATLHGAAPSGGDGSYLARFDGKSWRVLSGTDGLWPTAIFPGAKGSLLVVGLAWPGQQLWRCSPEGGCRLIPLPQPRSLPRLIRGVVEAPPGVIWVAVEHHQRDCGRCYDYDALLRVSSPAP